MEIKNSTKRFKIFIALAGLTSLFLIIHSIQSCSILSNATRDLQLEQSSGRKWAQPIDLPGVPNLYKVSDNLYRGAQPTKQGFQNLSKLGIKTIINLRESRSDFDTISDSNFIYEQIDTLAWDLKDKDVSRFLQIVRDKQKQPVFVHCRRGADRTGTMCAVYRIIVEDWSKEQAIAEMTKGGFGFHELFANLPAYIRGLDIEKIKQQAGLKSQVDDN